MRVSEEEEFLGADFCEHGINVRRNEKVRMNGNEEHDITRGQINTACSDENYEENEREAATVANHRKEQSNDDGCRDVEEHGYITETFDIDLNA